VDNTRKKPNGYPPPLGGGITLSLNLDTALLLPTLDLPATATLHFHTPSPLPARPVTARGPQGSSAPTEEHTLCSARGDRIIRGLATIPQGYTVPEPPLICAVTVAEAGSRVLTQGSFSSTI